MDAYDHMVAYLTDNPDQIHDAWNIPTGHVAGALFAPLGSGCEACLTQLRVRNSYSPGYLYGTAGLAIAEEVRLDERIPSNGNGITLKHLPIFAEWQRRIDKELNRVPPVWVEPNQISE